MFLRYSITVNGKNLLEYVNMTISEINSNAKNEFLMIFFTEWKVNPDYCKAFIYIIVITLKSLLLEKE